MNSNDALKGIRVGEFGLGYSVLCEIKPDLIMLSS